MKGEIVGRVELAMVPDAAKLRELTTVTKKPVVPEPAPIVVEEPPVKQIKSPKMDHPLLAQADAFYRQADHENAIRACTAIIDNASLANEIRSEARKCRGAAYLARGGKTDIDRALIDQLAAGLPGVQMTVRAASADLKVVNDVKGKVKKNQTLLVTKISGDWLWVNSVDGSDRLQGYLPKDVVLEQAPAKTSTASTVKPASATVPAATTQPAQATAQNMNYYNNGYTNNGYTYNNGYSNNGYNYNNGYSNNGYNYNYNNGYNNGGYYYDNGGGGRMNGGGFFGGGGNSHHHGGGGHRSR
jgi:hypothetical protein